MNTARVYQCTAADIIKAHTDRYTCECSFDGRFFLELAVDQDPMSPREWDNLGTIYAEHPRYNFSDGPDIRDDDGKIDRSKYLAWPLYAHEHSAIAFSLSDYRDPFDSGQLGYVYVEKARIRNNYGWKNLTRSRLQQITDTIKSEIETYEAYVNGYVYDVGVIDTTTDEHDYCGSFFFTGTEAEKREQLTDHIKSCGLSTINDCEDIAALVKNLAAPWDTIAEWEDE